MEAGTQSGDAAYRADQSNVTGAACSVEPSRLIVELVGLPGVGKSFLSRRIDEHFRREGVRRVSTTFVPDDLPLRSVRPLLGKLARAARFAALHVETTAALANIIRSDGDGLSYARLTKLINLLSELARSAGVPAETILVSEQGVLQAIWSLEMRASDTVRDRLLRQCRRWLPDAVVLVDVDWQQNADRIRSRRNGRSHFDALPAERLDIEAQKGEGCLHAILDAWAAGAPAERRLDFRNDTDSDTGLVVSWLAALRADERLSIPEQVDALGDARLSEAPLRSDRRYGARKRRGLRWSGPE